MLTAQTILREKETHLDLKVLYSDIKTSKLNHLRVSMISKEAREGRLEVLILPSSMGWEAHLLAPQDLE